MTYSIISTSDSHDLHKYFYFCQPWPTEIFLLLSAMTYSIISTSDSHDLQKYFKKSEISQKYGIRLKTQWQVKTKIQTNNKEDNLNQVTNRKDIKQQWKPRTPGKKLYE